MPEDEYLRAKQAADLLGFSVSTLTALADAGRIPFRSTPGAHRRYRRSDVIALGLDLDRKAEVKRAAKAAS